MNPELTLTADMKMHDVVHVSRLDSYRRRFGMIANNWSSSSYHAIKID